jgi:hypothetical protein
MKFKFIICFFLIGSVHAIAWDPVYKYELMKRLYPNMTRQMFFLLHRDCTSQDVDINEMGAIAQRESEWKNIISNDGRDASPYQINGAHLKKGESLEMYLDLNKSTPKAVSVWKSAKKKAKGDIAEALIYYNCGEGFNPEDYPDKLRKSYIDAIVLNYEKSRSMDSLIIKIN